MGVKYSSDVVTSAEQVLSDRRKAAEADQQQREKYIYSQIPEVGAIQRRIREKYHSLIMLVAAHDKDAGSKAEQIHRDIVEVALLQEGLSLILQFAGFGDDLIIDIRFVQNVVDLILDLFEFFLDFHRLLLPPAGIEH